MDKSRLIEAKRKNEIIHMCKEWNSNGIEISLEDFYDLQGTLLLQENIISRLDEFDIEKKYLVCANNESIKEFMKHISERICEQMSYVFFEANATKIGAIKLSGDTILNNIDYVISNSELLHGGCSIFICSCGLENGICLWRGEYDIRIYLW